MNSPAPSPQTCSVSITGIGVFTAAGDLGAALWGAVATRLSASRLVPGLSVTSADMNVAKPFYAPIVVLPEQLKSEFRIPIMAREALSRACTALPEDRIGLRILILTLLPASSPKRPNAGELDRNKLAASLRETHPALAMAEVRFVQANAGAACHLAQCMEELNQGQWDGVLFGGVDSLTDPGTIRALAALGHCRTDRNPEGILPGEGAAYLLLEKPETAKSPLAVVAGLGHGREASPGQAANCRMTGLAESIEQALAQAQCMSSQVETIVLPMGNDVPSTLEWHQVKRKLWSRTEDDNAEMEELTPQGAIGDTGAAALPLSLVIGCARFEFNFPPVERILVCEAGQGEPRGAVFLKKSSNSTLYQEGQSRGEETPKIPSPPRGRG
jgi:3-oxoacyl-[acyl-carrier-protein] synthase-1